MRRSKTSHAATSPTAVQRSVSTQTVRPRWAFGRSSLSLLLAASMSMTLLVGLTGIQPASAGSLVSAISTGVYYSCALTAAGGVKCWGTNKYGQLGDGTTTRRWTPVDVAGLTSGVSAVSAGDLHTCALTTAGGVKCWGNNLYGALGDGSTTDSLTPVDVFGLTSGVSAISAGRYHTCALTTTGGVKCWGGAYLGDGTTTNSSTPVNVSGLTSGVKAISAGGSYSCALTTAGAMKCWGVNWYGQLGDGTTTNRLTPVDVSGLTSGVKSISAGEYHACAVTTSGGVRCWGENWFGQLGDGTTTSSSTPVNVSGLSSGVEAISAGIGHSCALTTAGGVKCWGDGYLGDGTATSSSTPVEVSKLASGVQAISAGFGHSCALTTAGAMKCWGGNWYGQLGDGTQIARLKPRDVSGLPGSPRLSSFAPITGGVGTTVTLTGHNLNHATKVSFNGVVASFTVVSNTLYHCDCAGRSQHRLGQGDHARWHGHQQDEIHGDLGQRSGPQWGPWPEYRTSGRRLLEGRCCPLSAASFARDRLSRVPGRSQARPLSLRRPTLTIWHSDGYPVSTRGL
jgi:alpha-tubulin suppressor-like RCC1 family protein